MQQGRTKTQFSTLYEFKINALSFQNLEWWLHVEKETLFFKMWEFHFAVQLLTYQLEKGTKAFHTNEKLIKLEAHEQKVE